MSRTLADIRDPYPCPACGLPSYWVRAMDRYVHRDGSANRACWVRVARGDVPGVSRLFGERASERLPVIRIDHKSND